MDNAVKIDLATKLELAKKYLRERGKYVLDPDCEFAPTPSTDRFSIVKKYGQKIKRERK